jgi:hypothetical protein
LSEIVVEVCGKGVRILQLAQTEPLSREILDERTRPRVPQHAPGLLEEHGAIFQFSLNCRLKQFVVRTIAPNKERKARCEFQRADFISLADVDIWRLALEAENKLRVGQYPAQS